MIPKIIHYCWFGRNPKPKLAEKCIKSWKKYCPDYKIVEWNEDNFDIPSAPLYVRQAYEAKKWAFVTDYVRLQVVYENGGVYLDTDVELVHSLDAFLRNEAYFGFEGGKFINTGLGFGAEKQHPILLDMMEDYKNIPFILDDGTFDGTTCPQRNTEVFLKHGLVQNNTRQYVNGSLILPSDYLCPVDYSTGKLNQTENTASIHWFSASWQSNDEKACRDERIREFKRIDRIHRVRHLPNFILRWILGNDRYERLKKHLKRG